MLAAGNANSNTDANAGEIQFKEMMCGKAGSKVIKVQLPSNVYNDWVKLGKGNEVGKLVINKPVKDIEEQQVRLVGTLACTCTGTECRLSLEPIRDVNLVVYNEDKEGYSLEGVVTHSGRSTVTHAGTKGSANGKNAKPATVARIVSEDQVKANEDEKPEEYKREAEGVRHRDEPAKKVAKTRGSLKEKFIDRLINAFTVTPELTLDQIKEKTGQERGFRFKDVLNEYCNCRDGIYTLKESTKALMGLK